MDENIQKEIGNIIDDIFDKEKSGDYIDQEQSDTMDILKRLIFVVDKLNGRFDNVLNIIAMTNDRITDLDSDIEQLSKTLEKDINND